MTTKIEKEFSLIKNEVQQKLQEAAKLIKEANQLCEDKTNNDIASLEYDGYFYDEETGDSLTGELMSALENAGWQTSSMSC